MISTTVKQIIIWSHFHTVWPCIHKISKIYFYPHWYNISNIISLRAKATKPGQALKMRKKSSLRCRSSYSSMFVCCNLPQNSILASASPLHSSPFHLPSLQFQHLNVSKYLAKMLLPGQKTRGQHNETLLHFRQSHANAHTHKKQCFC